MAQSKKKTPKPTTNPVDPSDFSDLGPVVEAPDDVKPPAEVKAPVKAAFKPPPQPKEIVLSPKDVLNAIVGGDSTGLPLQPDSDPFLKGDKGKEEITLITNSTSITAGIAGHAVDCDLVSEVRLVQWKVRGSADQLSGKYRLTNDIRMAIRGNVVPMKKGKEFFDHQISVEAVRQAGGIVIPVGTQR